MFWIHVQAVFAAVLACAFAKPQLIYNGLGLGAPIQYATGPIQYAAGPIQYAASPIQYAAAPAIIAPAVTKTQYHAQDEFGQASHGYAHPGQAAAEVRDAFGNVRGSYAYIDPNGKEVRVNYVADAVNGFRVESNALPVAPEAPAVPALVAPEPVTETPEVAQARAEHEKAVAAAAAAAAAEPEEPAPAQSRRKRGIAYTIAAPVTYAASPVTYAAAPIALAAPTVALRQATLTKVVNNPGHAISYSVA